MVICAALYGAVCVAAAQVMIRLIRWFIINCDTPSQLCCQVEWWISYWWIIFVAASLLAAVPAYLIYRMFFALKPLLPTESNSGRLREIQ